jgi:hypothetical protein
MDTNECNTVIAAARSAAGRSTDEVLQRMDEAGRDFTQAAREHFGREGEW